MDTQLQKPTDASPKFPIFWAKTGEIRVVACVWNYGVSNTIWLKTERLDQAGDFDNK